MSVCFHSFGESFLSLLNFQRVDLFLVCTLAKAREKSQLAVLVVVVRDVGVVVVVVCIFYSGLCREEVYVHQLQFPCVSIAIFFCKEDGRRF